MSDIISPILEWLNKHPELSGLFTFLISAGESVAILGTIVPGSIMMTAIGTLAGAGVIPLWPTIMWAILGAIVGDGISYWIGHYFKDRLPYVWPFRKYPSLLKTGEVFFHKHGSKSVFIGRFVGPVRALVPLVAGMLGMKPFRFYIANILSAIGWAPAYMLPGIMLGAASLELPPDIAIHVILVLLLIGLFILLCLWFIYKFMQLIAGQFRHLLHEFWERLKTSKHLTSVTVLLGHYDEAKIYGQLTLAFYFILTVILFLLLVLYVKLTGSANITVNDAMFHFFRGIRNDTLDNIAIRITFLAQKEVLLPVMFGAVIVLYCLKNFRASAHTLLLTILTAGGIFTLKNIIKNPRPWGIAHPLETYSMPSGHATLSTAFYLGFALLIGYALQKRYRYPIYTLAVVIVFTTSISRMYLGAHYLTDILSSWLLGAAILMFVTISYRREYTRPVHSSIVASFILVLLAASYLSYDYSHFNEFKIDHEQLEWPRARIDDQEWWSKGGTLPSYHVSLFGFPSQKINVEWTGSLSEIRKTLAKAGWVKPPSRDWISTLHRITDVSSAQYLPLISPHYLDKKPALILVRQLNNGKMNNAKRFLVLRLWNSNRILQTANTPLWVGTIGIIPRSFSWIYQRHASRVEPEANLLLSRTATPWQAKLVTIQLQNANQLLSRNPILLIKKK